MLIGVNCYGRRVSPQLRECSAFWGIVPGLTVPVFFVAGVWMLAAFVVAVRQALDYTSTGRAVGVCLIGWLVNGAILFFLGFILLR